MRTFLHLVIALVLAQDARALTVEIEADATGIPVFGAFTGTAIVTNDSGASVRIAAPSMMLGSLRYEVRGRSETILVGASYCVSTAATPEVSLDADESVRLPVYLMKSNGVYLFGEVGPVQVRCIVASDYGSHGKSEESASKWLELLVTPEISSEQWRAFFSSVVNVKFPFDPSVIPTRDPLFSRFRGSRYFRSHVIYQDLSLFAFGNQQTPDLIAGFLHENQEFMSGAEAATKMWEALSQGSYCFDGGECANGSYYLGRCLRHVDACAGTSRARQLSRGNSHAIAKLAPAQLPVGITASTRRSRRMRSRRARTRRGRAPRVPAGSTPSGLRTHRKGCGLTVSRAAWGHQAVPGGPRSG